MKCDNCGHQKYMPDDNEMNCDMGHWVGLGPPETDEDHSLWDDCKDFDTQSLNLTDAS